MATKKTNTFNYLGVPGLSASGKFDNSLYTPATKPKAAPTAPSASQDAYASNLGKYFGGVGLAPAAPSTPLPVIPTATVRNMADGPITVDSVGENVTSTTSVSTPPTTSALPEIDASNGLIRYSPEWQRFQDQREQALADAAAGKGKGIPPKPTTPESQGGGIPDAPKTPAKEISSETRDAFALIKSTLASYGLEELASSIEQLMKDGVTPQEGLLKLKTDKAYNAPYLKRFAGNEARRNAGLNVYSEGEYLALEDSYSQSLKAYGQSDYFGKTKDEKRTQAAAFIGGDVSAKEFDDVLNVVVNEVKNKDPFTKAAMKQLYGIDEAGLVKYFLDPKKNLPELQQQAQAAQIGGAALMQGVDAKGENLLSIGNSMSLAKLGVTQAQAQEGYGKIAETLPTAQKLGNIYNEEKIAYTQGTAEEETFQNLASAKRKRMQLANKEIGSFSADSGRGKGAFSSPISI